MNHQHAATGETRGHVYEVCDCGAVRRMDRATNRYDAWHACALCSTADPEYASRLDAERVTLEFAQRSTRRVDASREPIDESPLFGGRKQGGLFE